MLVLGLDRAPKVKTLRRKLAQLTAASRATELGRRLADRVQPVRREEPRPEVAKKSGVSNGYLREAPIRPVVGATITRWVALSSS